MTRPALYSIASRSSRRAFTLIELLVVVSIISLLIGILLPALGRAREAAQQIVCAANQRNLAQGLLVYANSNNDFYPGKFTSGWEGNFNRGRRANELWAFDTSSSTPVQNFDWISPSIGDSMNFSTNRAQRFKQCYTAVADPSAQRIKNNFVFWAGGESGTAPDRDQLDELAESAEGIPQASYLMPHAFVQPGRLYDASYVFSAAGRRFQDLIPLLNLVAVNPAVVEPTFRPRLDLVGTQLSNKIMIADGTRYYVSRERVLDFDGRTAVRFYGGFTTSGPYFARSPAYGSNFGDGEQNRLLSYRHGGNINVAFFDGHVESMTEAQSRSNPGQWYPSGSIWNGRELDPRASLSASLQSGDKLP